MGTGKRGVRGPHPDRIIIDEPFPLIEEDIPGFTEPQYDLLVHRDGSVTNRKGDEIMAKPARRVVVQHGVRKPGKVSGPIARKPKCKFHKIEMTFDPLEEKWRCTAVGCDITARPKRTDGEVIMGKGRVSLRVVMTGKDVQYILMSDDSVALNITDLMSTHVRRKVWEQCDEEVRRLQVMGEQNGKMVGEIRLTLAIVNVFLANLLSDEEAREIKERGKDEDEKF